ncbi:MAG: extracellular solute-binding protein, partial [Spirochaetaceae bacterium]|nr:extracellular solute-binding protein [Spirochaetaceae bacterium]
MVKKALVTGLILFLLLGILAGCGNSRDAGDRRKIIKLAGTLDPAIDEANKANFAWIESAVAAFEAANPGYKVEYEAYKYDQIDTKLMTDYQAGIERGVSMVSDSLLVEHYKAGDLMDLTPYFDGWPQADREDFLWLNNLDAFRNNGRLYALPLEMHVRTIAFRKDLFVQAGLDPNAVPRTTEELVAYAKALTRGNVYGLGIYLGNERATNEVSFSPYLWLNGGELFDDTTKMAIFASAEGVKTAQFLSDLVNVHKVTPEYMVSGGYNDILTGFINGEFAMIEGFGNYWFNNLQQEGLAVGLNPPSVEANSGTVGLMVAPPGSSRYVNYWTFGISESCTEKDAAVKLLYTLLRTEHLEKYIGGLPPRQSMLDKPAY